MTCTSKPQDWIGPEKKPWFFSTRDTFVCVFDLDFVIAGRRGGRRGSRDRDSYDAKALMAEEQEKYAEYKAQYARRQSSSHSSENEDAPRPGATDQTRCVHHERQPALYGASDAAPISRAQHPDQYLYSPQQRRRVPQEQLPATREQHLPEMSRYPPNSYVQYPPRRDQPPQTRGYSSSTYQQPPVTSYSSGRYEPDNRHKYIREYEIPDGPAAATPAKPKQEFILRWGPQQKSPSVERVIGRHTPDRGETGRFGQTPPEGRLHRRSASDGFPQQYEGGGVFDQQRSPSMERTERFSSPDRRAYQIPGSPRHQIPGSPSRKTAPPKKQQLWHYNHTYEDHDDQPRSSDTLTSSHVTSPTQDALSPYDTLKSSSSSGHSAPVRPSAQVTAPALLSQKKLFVGDSFCVPLFTNKGVSKFP